MTTRRKVRSFVFQSIEKALKFRPLIPVTQYAIDHSVRNNPHMCMFVRSIAYALPGTTRIVVDRTMTRFNLGGYRFTYQTPAVVAKMIHDFDDNKKVRPWRVQLQPPLGVRPTQNRPPQLHSDQEIKEFTKKKARLRRLAARRTETTGVRHSPITGKPVGNYRTGKYQKQSDSRKCGSYTSRRWHGLVLPKNMVPA